MNIDKDELLRLLQEKYGDLDNDRGCCCNGEWLSIARIIEVVNECQEY